MYIIATKIPLRKKISSDNTNIQWMPTTPPSINIYLGMDLASFLADELTYMQASTLSTSTEPYVLIPHSSIYLFASFSIPSVTHAAINYFECYSTEKKAVAYIFWLWLHFLDVPRNQMDTKIISLSMIGWFIFHNTLCSTHCITSIALLNNVSDSSH